MNISTNMSMGIEWIDSTILMTGNGMMDPFMIIETLKKDHSSVR